MIYDYKCTKCKQITEVIQSYKHVGDFKCKCGGINRRYFGNQRTPIYGLDTLTGEFFDPGEGRWLPKSKRDQIGKKEGKIWMSHDEAEKEAAKNMKNHHEKIDNKLKHNVRKGLERIFK
jgi:hypothetical protein